MKGDDRGERHRSARSPRGAWRRAVHVALLALTATGAGRAVLGCHDDEGSGEAGASAMPSTSTNAQTSSAGGSGGDGGAGGGAACQDARAKMRACGVPLDEDPIDDAPCAGFNECVADCTNAAPCDQIVELLDDVPGSSRSPYVDCVDACLAESAADGPS